MIDFDPKSLVTTRDRVWITLVALAVLLVAAYFVFAVRPDQARAQGEVAGAAQCVAATATQAVTATVAAATEGVSKAQKAIDKAQLEGAAHERDRLRIDKFFDNLSLEASHDAPHPVDACVLPADRLRRWAAANAGPAGTADPGDQGSPLREHDPAAAGPASAPVGRDAGSGDGSPGSGEGLPPGGDTTLSPPEETGD